MWNLWSFSWISGNSGKPSKSLKSQRNIWNRKSISGIVFERMQNLSAHSIENWKFPPPPEKSHGPLIFFSQKIAAPSFFSLKKVAAPSFFSPEKSLRPVIFFQEKVSARQFILLPNNDMEVHFI